jgi:single-stranded-DNA-specific exonuclease
MTFLEKLSPFGPKNMRPKFATTQLEIDGIPKIIGNGDHIRFKVKSGQKSFPVIGFNLAHKYQDLINGNPIDIAFVIEINRWRGQETIQLNARDIRPSIIS